MKNVEISLTEFMDFVLKSGPAKLTKVKNVIKMRSNPYEPFMDFYKPIRSEIIELHRRGKKKEDLRNLLEELKDDKKINIYPALVDGYIRFLGRKEIGWFEPPSKKWIKDELSIAINPELGLEIKGINYVVKLYFKQEPLDKRHADIILTMMKSSLDISGIENSKLAVLDVARGKSFLSDGLKNDLMPLVEGEALSFLSMWNNLFNEAA